MAIVPEKEEEKQARENMFGSNAELAAIDRELEELLKKQLAKVKVFGVGGGGGNTLSRMKEIGIKGCEMIAVNTDAQDLLYTNADHKILIGKELTMGLGAGSNPRIGEEAAHESEQEIKKKLSSTDMIFITCGLGGGTGTGAAPVIAELAKKNQALVVGVVTLPFSMEGKKRIENAVKGITELVTKSGLVNLDVADVKAVMLNGGVSLIGMGESDSQHRAMEAVEKAISNPLLDVDISNASGALINIIGGPDLTLDEAKIIVSTVGEKLSQDAKMIWGAQISDDLEKSIRVMLIVTGVKSSQIIGTSSGTTPEQKKKAAMTNELGIEFLE